MDQMSIFCVLFCSISAIFGQQQNPFVTSPFDNLKGKYMDFKSQALDLEAQYCKSLCLDRFQQLYNFNNPNRNCAPCYCDSECYKYNDCCPDKILFEKLESKIEPDTMHGCHGVTFQNNIPDEYYRMIDQCPESFSDQEIKENCYNSDSLHWKYVKPYFDFKTNETYRNEYCAVCNGVINAMSYKTEITCQTSDDYGTSTNSTGIYYHVISNYRCQIRFNLPTSQSIDRRRCDNISEPFYSTCNETGTWVFYDERVERACQLYTHIVKGRLTNTYKNFFCRLCNENIFWHELMQEPDGRLGFALFSMTSLLDLGDEDDIQKTRFLDAPSNTITCSDDEILNPLSCQCEQIFCSENKRLRNGQCQSVFLKSNNFGYEICVRVEGTFNTTASKPLFAFGLTLPDYDSPYYPVDRHATPIKIEDCGTGLIDIIADIKTKMVFEIPVHTDDTELDIVQRMKQLGEEVSLYGGEMISKLERECPPPAGIPGFSEPESFCNGIPTKPFQSQVHIKQEIGSALKKIEFIPLTKLLTCTQILVNLSQVTHDPRTLTLLHNNVTLSSAEFEIRDDQFVVCTEDFLSGTNIDKCYGTPTDLHQNRTNGTGDGEVTATPLGILSVVCTCISLLFLIITFVFYCIIKYMKNVVGVNVMGLIINLFMAQLVYEFGLELFDYPDLCKAMAILIHYFWLSSTFWMNCCTIVLFIKLTFPLQSRAFTTKYILLRSCLYSTISPLVIVGLTIVVNMSNNGTMGYGNSSICYMNYTNDRRYAFALPLGLLILINIGLFSFTFIKIRLDQVDSAINRENKINILACLKLSVITGAAWIFVFIYEATGAIVFSYLFTILVGTQGVVIFLAFVVNKRVCMACKGKVQGRSDSSSSGMSKQKKYLVKSTDESPLPSLSKSKNSTDSDKERAVKLRSPLPKFDEKSV